MNGQDWYFYSTERPSRDLPTLCRQIHTLKTANDREAVLFDCLKEIDTYRCRYLVLIPKHVGGSILRETPDDIAVYVLDGTPYRDADSIDLSAKTYRILDWGGVTRNLELAKRWQMRDIDVELSRATLKKFGIDE